MRPETEDRGDYREWLRYARADLALASIPLPAGARYEQLCFHAQQATEKALKGLLVHLGRSFPKVHSIARLIGLLPSEIAEEPWLTEAADLSLYAGLTRYPWEAEPITEEQYREALGIAREVVAWVERQLPAA